MTLYGPTDLDPGTQTATYAGPGLFNRHPVYLSWILDPLTFPVGIEEAMSTKPFDLYPNPSHGLLNISFESSGEIAQADIYDLTGSQLHHTQLQAGGGQLDLSSLPSGMYLLRLRIGNSIATKRFVVQ
jgi:hypothetical protein